MVCEKFEKLDSIFGRGGGGAMAPHIGNPYVLR